MAAQIKSKYEGEPVPDGEYTLGQLSKNGYGRVLKRTSKDYDLYNEMPVMISRETFESLFMYVKTRENSINDFKAVVKNEEIIHVYE